MWSSASLLASSILISSVWSSPIIDYSKLYQRNGIWIGRMATGFTCPKQSIAMQVQSSVYRGTTEIEDSAWVTCSIRKLQKTGQSPAQCSHLVWFILDGIGKPQNVGKASDTELQKIKGLNVEARANVDFSPQYGGEILVGDFRRELLDGIRNHKIRNKVVAEWVPAKKLCVPLGAVWDYTDTYITQNKYYKKCKEDKIYGEQSGSSSSYSGSSSYQGQNPSSYPPALYPPSTYPPSSQNPPNLYPPIDPYPPSSHQSGSSPSAPYLPDQYPPSSHQSGSTPSAPYLPDPYTSGSKPSAPYLPDQYTPDSQLSALYPPAPYPPTQYPPDSYHPSPYPPAPYPPAPYPPAPYPPTTYPPAPYPPAPYPPAPHPPNTYPPAPYPPNTYPPGS